jgi:hypothetical protein
MSSQILLKLGEISAQIAVMTEQLKAVPDHETRLRSLEKFQFKTVGAAVVISALFSGLGTWIEIITTHAH